MKAGSWQVRHTLLNTSEKNSRFLIGKSVSDISLSETGPGQFHFDHTGGDPNSADLSHFVQTGEGAWGGDKFTLRGIYKSVAMSYEFTVTAVREK